METVSCIERDCVMGVVIGHVECRLSRTVGWIFMQVHHKQNILIPEQQVTDTRNNFRHMASKKIKQIITTNRLQTIHKRHQHNLNQIKGILQEDNLRVAKADKNKEIVIINKTMLERKVQTLHTRK